MATGGVAEEVDVHFDIKVDIDGNFDDQQPKVPIRRSLVRVETDLKPEIADVLSCPQNGYRGDILDDERSLAQSRPRTLTSDFVPSNNDGEEEDCRGGRSGFRAGGHESSKLSRCDSESLAILSAMWFHSRLFRAAQGAPP